MTYTERFAALPDSVQHELDGLVRVLLGMSDEEKLHTKLMLLGMTSAESTAEIDEVLGESVRLLRSLLRLVGVASELSEGAI